MYSTNLNSRVKYRVIHNPVSYIHISEKSTFVLTFVMPSDKELQTNRTVNRDKAICFFLSQWRNVMRDHTYCIIKHAAWPLRQRSYFTLLAITLLTYKNANFLINRCVKVMFFFSFPHSFIMFKNKVLFYFKIFTWYSIQV